MHLRVRADRRSGSRREPVRCQPGRGGGMVDAAVSKTAEGNLVRVRLPLPARRIGCCNAGFGIRVPNLVLIRPDTYGDVATSRGSRSGPRTPGTSRTPQVSVAIHPPISMV